MNIWLFHHYAIAPTEAGITRHYTLLRELKRLGHSVMLIGADRHHRKKNTKNRVPKGAVSSLNTSHDVPYLQLRTLTSSASYVPRVFNMLAFSWRIFRWSGLKDLERPDLIIGCTPDLFSAYMVSWLARKYDVPFVFHVGELWPLMLTEVGGISPWHPFVLLFGWIEKQLYRRAGSIVVAQQHADRHIAERCADVDVSKVCYVPNGADLSVCPKPRMRRGELNAGRFRVMYIGAMGNANGVEEIIDAAACVTDNRVEFVLMGDGPLRKQLELRAKKAGRDNVIFLPPVPRDEVYLRMQDADVFIVNVPDKKPYRYGLAHNKIFDYMAVARPTVIATNTQENPISDCDAGILVPSNDAKQMAVAVEALANKGRDELDAMGQRARKAVEDVYDFSILAKKLEAALLKVLKAYNGSRPSA